MGLFDSLIGAGMDALGLGGSDAGSSSSQSLADAYKGDGPMGIGSFLTGIATAYLKEHTQRSEVVDRLRPTDKAKLDAAIGHALDHFLNTQYHKDAAIADARAARDNAFHEYADEFLPTLYARTCSAGIWNSTAAQLLANDAYARTVVKAEELELTNIKQYAEIHLREGDAVNAMFGNLIQSYQTDNWSQDMERRPDVEEFAKDAAIFTVFMATLSLFSKRNYLADRVGSSTDSTGASTGLWDWLPLPGTIIA